MLINGVSGYPVEDLTLENIRLELPGGGTADAQTLLPEKEAAYPEFDMSARPCPPTASTPATSAASPSKTSAPPP